MDFSPLFYSGNFIVLYFTLRSITSYFEFTLYNVWGMYPDYLFYFILPLFSLWILIIDPAAPCEKQIILFHWIDSHIVKNQLTTFVQLYFWTFILTVVSISNLLLWSLKVYSSLQASKVAEMVKNVYVYRFFGSFLYRQSCHGNNHGLMAFSFQSVCLVFLCCCIGYTSNTTSIYTIHTYKYVLLNFTLQV